MKRCFYFPDSLTNRFVECFSHLWCAGLPSNYNPSSHTWALPLCKAHFNCLKQKHQATRTARSCQKLFLSDQIFLHFQEPVWDPDSCERRCPTAARHMGLPPWQCTGVVGHFWSPEGMERKRSLSTEQQTGSLSPPQTDEPYSSKCRDVLPHQPQLNVTVCHLHTPDFPVTLKPLPFPRNASQMSDWRRGVEVVGKIPRSSLAFPWWVRHRHNTPTHHQTTSTQLTQGFF